MGPHWKRTLIESENKNNKKRRGKRREEKEKEKKHKNLKQTNKPRRIFLKLEQKQLPLKIALLSKQRKA